MRTFAALLTFFATFAVTWLAAVLAWAGIVWSTGFHDPADAIGLVIVLYLVPLIAVAVACAMAVVTPRQFQSSR